MTAHVPTPATCPTQSMPVRRGLALVSGSPRRTPPLTTYSLAQASRLLEHLQEPSRWVIKGVLSVGPTPDELSAVTWSRIYPDRRQMLIEGQGSNATRFAAFSKMFAAELAARPRSTALVFADATGRVPSPQALLVALDDACRRADLPPVTIDDLRWSLAKWLIDAGVGSARVTAHLGMSRRTFERRFHHLPTPEVPLEQALETFRL